MKKPTLCIVICVHNAPEYASICIESVLKHTYGSYELILVNDGSQTEATNIVKHFAREYPHVRMLHHSTPQGYTKAANAGMRLSRADYTILLNSDTIVSPGWAEQIIHCGESDEKIGIVGPLSNAATYQSVPILFDESGDWKHNILPGEVTVGSYAEEISRIALKSYPRVPVANGFCFAVKRTVIDTIGLLDEETFPQGYGEENDYCLRATDAGFEIAIADDTYVYHAVSKSFGNRNRKRLTRQAHHAIRKKYSVERLNEVDQALRNHAGMALVRERIMEQIERAPNASVYAPKQPLFGKPNQNFSTLFLLPDCAASAGGTQVIVELARGLDALGVPVKLATKESARQDYETFFPADNHLMLYYKDDRELLSIAGSMNIAVATIFHSTRQLRQIVGRHDRVLPIYFVQDYEPWFLDNHPQQQELAQQSYTMVPNCQAVVISPWVQAMLKEQHDVSSHKIRGSLDRRLFYPDYDKETQDKVIVSAMVRPNTPWRAPERTLRVLKELKGRYGEHVDIRIFGCTDDDLQRHALDCTFELFNYGVLNRHDVAGLLRASDIFLDLSDFQAFGRTALEAMACGCAVIAPTRGGVHDFGKHGHNIALIDTAEELACIEASSQLIEDAELRQILRNNAIRTTIEYDINRSALEFLQLAAKLKGTQAKQPHQVQPTQAPSVDTTVPTHRAASDYQG